MPESPVTVDKIPHQKNESLYLSPQNSKDTLAPDIGKHEQSVTTEPLNRSRIVETDGTSTHSSGVDHQPRRVAEPSVPVDEISLSQHRSSTSESKTHQEHGTESETQDPYCTPPESSVTGDRDQAAPLPSRRGSPLKYESKFEADHENEPLRPSPQDSSVALTPDVGTDEQSVVETEAQKRRTVPANAPNLCTKSRGSEERDSLIDDDSTSLQAGHEKNTPTSLLEVGDALQSPPSSGNPKPAVSMSPTFDNGAYPHTGRHPRSHTSNLEKTLLRSEPSKVSEDAESSTTNATSRFSQPQVLTTPTSPKYHRIRHRKSLGAEARAFHPRQFPSSLTTPRGTYGNSHGKPASNVAGQSIPSHSLAMRTTPRAQHSSWPSRQSSMGTPSVSVGSGRVQHPARAPHPSTSPGYPKPHQHTPKGQPQYFPTIGSPPIQMPNRMPQPFNANRPPFPSPVQSSPMQSSSMQPSPMHPFEYNSPRFNAYVQGQDEHNVDYSQSNQFDSYANSQAASATPNASDIQQNGSMFTQEPNGYARRYYPSHTDPTHQVDFCPRHIIFAGLMKI